LYDSLPTQEELWDNYYTGVHATTAAVRRAIQDSQESLNTLAQCYAINPKTVAKWKKRSSCAISSPPYPINPYHPDRQRYSVHPSQTRQACFLTYLRSRLPGKRYGTSPDPAKSSLDQLPGRTHEPHSQGSNCQALSLRQSSTVARAPLQLPECLQLRQTTKTLRGLTPYEYTSPNAGKMNLNALSSTQTIT